MNIFTDFKEQLLVFFSIRFKKELTASTIGFVERSKKIMGAKSCDVNRINVSETLLMFMAMILFKGTIEALVFTVESLTNSSPSILIHLPFGMLGILWSYAVFPFLIGSLAYKFLKDDIRGPSTETVKLFTFGYLIIILFNGLFAASTLFSAFSYPIKTISSLNYLATVLWAMHAIYVIEVSLIKDDRYIKTEIKEMKDNKEESIKEDICEENKGEELEEEIDIEIE